MRRDDEFNFVKVNNDSQLKGNEFSFTPKNESASYTDNQSTVTRDEVNDQFTSNSEHKEPEEQRRRREEKKEDANKENNESHESAESGSSGSEGSSSSSSSGTSSSSTSSASGSTASAVTGTVVGAATVAVTAIAAVAGLNVITGQSARVNIDVFSVEQTEVIYGVILYTDKEDFGNYIITVSNPSYNASRPLQKGPEGPESSDWPEFDPATEGWYNEGSFTNLTPGNRYDVTIKDSGIGGKVLYESTFLTPSAPNNVFNGVNFGGADYMTDEFTVTLDYYEATTGYFSDFSMVISNGSAMPLQLNLNATTEPQTVSSEDFNLMTDRFSYTLEYKENGTSKQDQGDFDFNNGGNRKSQFNSITVGPDANFAYNTFVVNADFTDNFHVITDISITFFDASSGAPGYTFPLDIGYNTVSAVVDEEVKLDLTAGPYNYRLNYYLKGDLNQTPDSFEDQDPVTFVDTSSSAYFDNITFSNPDFQTNSLDVKLDYSEVLDNTLKDFSLNISNGTTSTNVELDNTTEVQPINLSHVPEFNFNEDDYTYTLTFTNGHNDPTSVPGEFSFKGQAKSEVNGVTIDKEINFDTGEFLIELDMHNDLGLLSNFTFTLIDDDLAQEVCTENLMAVRTAQTITAPIESNNDYARDRFSYVLSYQDDGVSKTYDPRDTDPTYSFNFEISPDQEPEIDVVVNEKADFTGNKLHATLTYNDPHNFFRDTTMWLHIILAGETSYREFDLTKTSGVSQDVEIDSTKDFVISDHPSFEYYLDYTLPGALSRRTTRKSITVKDETLPEVTGLNTDFVAYDRYVGSPLTQVYQMAFQVEYTDDYSMYSGFTLECTSIYGTMTKTLTMTKGWQYVTFSDSDRDTMGNILTNNEGVTFTLKASKTGETTYDEFSLDETQLTNGGSTAKVHGVWFDSYTVSGDSIDLSYLIYDNASTFTNYSLRFVGSNSSTEEYSVSVTITSSDTAATVSVTLTSDILSILESHNADVVFAYTQGTVDKTEVICTNQHFTIRN